MEASVPPRLPGLELLRPIGRGAFGEVWLARTVTGQFRAVKLVPLGSGEADRQDLGERVFRGVQAYLDHLPPGSAAALAVLHVDRDPDGRFLYYVMELADDVAGGRDFAPEHYQALTLSEFRRRSPGQFVPAEETIRLGGKLAAGLAALHAAGLVHRDIKPNNVVFIGGEPRLADIDLVRPAEASLSVGGAQGYSPLEGPGRPTADVFSLARTLYVTVTGLPVGEFPRLPEDWDRRPDAPALRRLNAVLLRAADRDPAKRHSNAAALAEDLRRLERGEDVERQRQTRRHGRNVIATLTAFSVLAALFLTWGMPRMRREENQRRFDQYRNQLNLAADTLQLSDSTPAKLSLAALTNSKTSAIESDVLRRQIHDFVTSFDQARTVQISRSGVSGPVEAIVFNASISRLCFLGESSAHVYSFPSAQHLVSLPGISKLVGFLEPGNEVVGLTSDSDGHPMLAVWNSTTGQRLPQALRGRWVPAGILGDGQTVVALRAEEQTRLVRWRPFGGEAPVEETWSPRRLGSHGTQVASNFEPRVAINLLGNRIFLREEVIDDIGENARPRTEVYARYDNDSTDGFNLGMDGLFAVSADGDWIALNDQFGESVELSRTGSLRVRSQRITQNGVKALALTHNGRYVACGGIGKDVRVVDVRNGLTRSIFSRQFSPVTALTWSKDEAWLASGDAFGQVLIWNTASLKLGFNPRRTRIAERLSSFHAVVDPSETTIAVKGVTERITFFDGQSLAQIETIDRELVPLQLENSTNHLIWFLTMHGSLGLTKPEDHRDRWGIPPEDWNFHVGEFRYETNAFPSPVTKATGIGSADRRRFVVYAANLLAIWACGGRTVSRIAEARHPNGKEFTDAVISTDSRWAVVLADDGSALLADLDNGTTRLLKQLNEKAVTACFRPDSTECYFGTSGGRLLRLDTAKDDPPELLDANFGLPAHMIATPDGERLFTAGPGEQLGIRRLPDGAPIVQLTHHGLALEPGRHNLKRLLYLPKQQRVLSLSEDGWLTQW